MRIIGGEHRSRRLKTLPGLGTRPTPDRLRESLFSILAERVAGRTWYDCYAGSGAVGLEALSRGAEYAVFIESGRAAVRVVQENARALGVLERCTILAQPAAQALAAARRPPDVVFLDPPYEAAAEYRRILQFFGAGKLLKPDGLVIAQHSARAPLDERYGTLARYRAVTQGDNSLSFFKLE